MDPTGVPARPATRARTRAVVALTRPCTPNATVVRAAAELAIAHDCALLVLGTMDRLTVEWAEGLDVAGQLLQAAQGELFAGCVETLWDLDVRWGVNVLWGRIAAETRQLTECIDAVQVLVGGGRPPTLRHRLRRRVTGRLTHLLRDLPVTVVDCG